MALTAQDTLSGGGAQKETGNLLQKIETVFRRDISRQTKENLWLSSSPYSRYEGKIIRRIDTRQLGFEVGIDESVSGEVIDERIINYGADLLNRLHTPSRDETIRRNIYLRAGDALNPFLVADNERYLRTIPYLQDARIMVLPVVGSPDSVDILVVSKDVFGYSGAVGGLSTQRQKLGLSTINLAGTGQEVGFNLLHDVDRQPATGMEMYYSYQNVLHSFIDASIAYSRIHENLYDGREDEARVLLTLSHPLISQYKRWAGGFTIGHMRSLNYYPDYYGKGAYQYEMGLLDAWTGYNLGARKYLNSHELKVKKFIAVRYFNQHFFKAPVQIGKEKYDQRFNSQQGALIGITLFKQRFYRSRYIFGFGNTEDVPAGNNFSLVAGWYRQLDLSRPYLGMNFYHYRMSVKGDITGVYLRTGMFLQQRGIRDIGLLAGASFLSRIYRVGSAKLRQYIRFNYGAIYNRVALDPLRINNAFGLRGFTSDLASGDRRLSLRGETYLFLKQTLLGFNFAPFAAVDFSYLNSIRSSDYETGLFYALGAGIRMRNEDLGLSTFEIRASVLPRQLAGDELINFSFSVDLDFRNNIHYVNKPRLVELNSDENGDIY